MLSTQRWPRLDRFKEHSIELPVAAGVVAPLVFSANFDLAIGPANQDELRSFCEKFRRAAFVGLDMSMLMTNNAMK